VQNGMLFIALSKGNENFLTKKDIKRYESYETEKKIGKKNS